MKRSSISFLSTPESVPSQSIYFVNQRELKSEVTFNSRYRDHSRDTEEDVERDLMIKLSKNLKSYDPKKQKIKRGARGGVSDPFPFKLHRMLEDVERDCNTHIVSWLSHGRAFCVHKPKDFVTDIMPKYFRQTKITSFQRQLNLYGFNRLTKGVDSGAYYHELFLKGMKYLSGRMIRTKIKGTGHKSPANPHMEPNFYAMNRISPQESNMYCSETPTSPSLVSSASSISDLSNDDFLERKGDTVIVSFEGKSFHYLDMIEPFQLSSLVSNKISAEISWLEDLDDELKTADDHSFGSYLDRLVDTF